MDIYKIAAQQAFRFPSVRGALTVEQLYSLPLKGDVSFDLDTIARAINTELKGVTQESFVEETENDPKKSRLTVMLDIVKDVITTKKAESAAARNRLQRAVDRKKILDAIGAKKDAQLTTASLEELEKKLAELD